jgi:hypothetical protein
MKYRINIPPGWDAEPSLSDGARGLIPLLFDRFVDRAIPETVFFQYEKFRDELIELGWLVPENEI